MAEGGRKGGPNLVLHEGQGRNDQLATVAQMYYVENLTQRQVAAKTGFSVATISRMIAEARETGMVTVRVNRLPVHDHRLAEGLCSAFGLERAAVVASSGDPDLDEARVHEAGATLFDSLLRPKMTIGVTWGETLNKVIEMFEPRALEGCEVVQVTGALGHGDTAIDGPGLAFRLAEKLDAPCHLINAPARVRSRQLRDRLVKQPQIEKAMERAAGADVLLHGVGTLNRDSSLVRAGYLTVSDLGEAASRGAVAQVMAHVVDADCEEVRGHAGRAVGISLKSAARIRSRVGVISSRHREEAVMAALRGGMFTHLVTGEATARGLLALRKSKAA